MVLNVVVKALRFIPYAEQKDQTLQTLRFYMLEYSDLSKSDFQCWRC